MNILFVVMNIDTEHLGVMLLSSILKQNGHRVEVVEAKYKKIVKKLTEGEFDILAYSCPTLFVDHYLSLNREIKKRFKVFSVFGGPHPTFVPEMIEEEGVDCICRGESESAFLELVEKLHKSESLREIKNIWVKENGKVFKNDLRPLIEDLDDLPFPDRDLFPYSETFYKGKMHVVTSRGCPFDCSYCCHRAYNVLYGGSGKRVRRRSVENVISEIQQVKNKTSLKFVMFEDDLFVSSPQWIEEFCLQYQHKINIPFFCYTRVDTITPALIKKLKHAGCVGVSVGVETANEEVRKNLFKKKISKEEIVQAARLIKKEKIRLKTSNIIGIPGSSLEDDIETVKLNIECQADYCSANLLMPYPKTEIREYAIQKGLIYEEYPSSEMTSLMKFPSMRDKRARENLMKLFALTVEFPSLLPILRKIVYWPLGPLYNCLYVFWDGYTSFFRLYPTGFRGFFWGMKKFIHIFCERLWA